MKRWGLSLLFLSLTSAMALLVGPVDLGHEQAGWVLWQLRLPRLILALTAGASLAACGLIMQALLKNSLASPYTLGLGSAAALGAALGLLFLPSLPKEHPLLLTALIPGFLLCWRFFAYRPMAALVAAIASIALAVLLYRQGLDEATGLGALLGACAVSWILEVLDRKGKVPGEGLILAGVAMGLTCGAAVMLVHYLVDQSTSSSMLRWTMGSLSTVGAAKPLLMLACFACGLPLFLAILPALNHLLLGEDIASSRGLEVKGLRRNLLLLASFWTAALVALVGPIGFVGIVAPHAARILTGEDLRQSAPVAMILGAGLLAGCDALSRVIMGSMELPVGVITALLGGPFFLLLLLSNRSLKR